ncbi:probable glucuronoxylan glucuronosyltransferase F8H [Papaver somniferum]|uniref:probable glucuronoxylan glucuronosyltransferase F8H n=1 Tax=Papaver somniferum TaxID=3469 RepID=UPI000E6FDA9D|nr:probable glucuronoxylan glucuronosyltransferase F8H [Papaver somniferum]
MASSNKTRNNFTSNNQAVCTRTNQILALILITVTFFLTRIFNQSCPNNYSSTSSISKSSSSSQDLYFVNNAWPNRGFGNQLSLKIYVYDENEIDGLKELMYGRDGKITVDSCLKGQWGTQAELMASVFDAIEEEDKVAENDVKIHQLLLKSRFRTLKKEDADLFFVPTYVKCVRMMGGLTDKEINSTYVKVLSQMPYFRLSGGRDHIFVFPRFSCIDVWFLLLNDTVVPELTFSDLSRNT